MNQSEITPGLAERPPAAKGLNKTGQYWGRKGDVKVKG